MKKSYSVVFGLSMAACCYLLDAQTSAAAPTNTALDEIVVTASRTEEKIRDVSANISTISFEEIQQSPSRNLADLLTEKGLAHIQKYPGALTSIGLRGFRTDSHGNDLQGKVLILLDGRRAGTGNATKISTKNIERVEIIRGPGAVQYGSAGMGGVINVITRTGTSNSLFVEAGAGSFERVEGSVGGTIKEGNFDFAGSVTVSSYDDFDTGDGTTYYNTGIDTDTAVSLHGGYSFSDLHRFDLIFTGFDANEAGSPGYLSANDLDDYSDKRNYSIDGQYSGSSEQGTLQWMARYFWGKDENSWTNPTASNPDGWDDGSTSENDSDQQGVQAQLTALLGDYTFTGGFDWIDYEVKSTRTPKKTDYSNPALFLLGKGKYFDDKLTVNLGMRYDWYEVDVKGPAGNSEDQNNLTPQIGLAYLLTENVKVRAQYAQGFMMPSADQLAINTVSFGTRTVGNPNLDPEKSETYEGGVDIGFGALTTSLGYFYTNYDDKIITSYTPDGTQTWDNVGDATIAGIEMELAYDIGQPLNLNWELKPYISATFLTEYEDEETGLDLLYTSETNLSAGIVASDGAGTFCRFNVTHYGEQDVQDWESGNFPVETVELDSITVADLTAAYRFLETSDYGSFTVRGEINNLFDEDYAFVKGYPMPGINFFVSLRWDY